MTTTTTQKREKSNLIDPVEASRIYSRLVYHRKHEWYVGLEIEKNTLHRIDTSEHIDLFVFDLFGER